MISDMTEQGDVGKLEEGEAGLLCYECGADFRSRYYFLKHIRAHKKAEMFGLAMTEEDWEGMTDSEGESEEENDESEEGKKKEQKEEGQEGDCQG